MLLRKVSQSPALRGTILRVSPVLYGYVAFANRQQLAIRNLNHFLLSRCRVLLQQLMCPLFSVYATEVSVPSPLLALPKAFGYMLAKPRYGGNSVFQTVS